MITAVSGLVMLAFFLSTTMVGWIVRGASFKFGSIVNAGEVAAWQTKWIALPIAIAAIWGGARLTRNIKRAPERFAGLRLARTGFSAAIVATLLVGTLIGVTVPERLRRRQWGLDAASYARGYTLHRALLEYQELHGTLPPDRDRYIEAIRTLPDPNGSIAEALQYVDANGYQASSLVAATSTKDKPIPQRGDALRSSGRLVNGDPPHLSFNSYELRLRSEDTMFRTREAFIMRDGVIVKVSDQP